MSTSSSLVVLSAQFGTKRPPVQIRPPRPRSKATALSGKWPFSCPYSSEVQQRLPTKLPAQPLERLARLVVGHIRVHVHRHVDLRVPGDPYGHPRMHIKAAPRGAAGPASAPRGSALEARPDRTPGRRGWIAAADRVRSAGRQADSGTEPSSRGAGRSSRGHVDGRSRGRRVVAIFASSWGSRNQYDSAVILVWRAG